LDHTRKVKDVDQAPIGSEGYIFGTIISKLLLKSFSPTM